MKTLPAQPNVVILGAGFGGVYTARKLEKLWRGDPHLNITVVSRDNFFLMTPLLFEAGSGVLDPRHAVTPVRRMLDRTRFVEAEVEAVDFERKVVVARHAPGTEQIEIAYDQLVLALGGVTNTKIIPGSEHAKTFKTLADAIYFRNYVIDQFEHADAEGDVIPPGMLTFVVVGAGLVGVELMGELTSFVKNICKHYPRARRQPAEFHLIEAGPRILPEMEQELADYAKGVLEKRGVHVHVGTPVKEIKPDRVVLPDGSEIVTETIVLAAGVAPNPLLATFPLEKDRKGRIATDATLRSKSDPDVWALGDCASIPDPAGKPYPQLAQHALREAKVLAKNITCVLRGGGQKLEPFLYETMGTLAALGHFTGVGKVMWARVRGFIAWWVWRTYYLSQMPRFERKLRIVLDWTVALFFPYDIVKLDLFGDKHPTTRANARKSSGAAAPEAEQVVKIA
jgi:NADH:ubiquinone reductase (H+-translocating)